MFAVVRIRGSMQTNSKVEHTMKMLHLTRKNHATILPQTPEYRGMLQKTKDYITFGEISDETLKNMIERRGVMTDNKKPDAAAAVEGLKNGATLKELGLKPLFRLSPPIGGFKGGIKTAFPKGALGNRKEAINQLLEKML